MFRLSLLLALSMLFSVSCVMFLFSNKNWNSAESEGLRQARIQLQQAQQSLSLVETAIENNMAGSLSQDRDSLTVQLAVSLHELADQRSQQSIVFEQHLISDVFFTEVGIPVSVLVLDVQFMASHAPKALHLLDEIGAIAGAWPVDVRACDFVRADESDLKVGSILTVKCTLHVYHWALRPGLDRL